MQILQVWVALITLFIQKRMISKPQILFFLYLHSKNTSSFPFEATSHFLGIQE